MRCGREGCRREGPHDHPAPAPAVGLGQVITPGSPMAETLAAELEGESEAPAHEAPAGRTSAAPRRPTTAAPRRPTPATTYNERTPRPTRRPGGASSEVDAGDAEKRSGWAARWEAHSDAMVAAREAVVVAAAGRRAVLLEMRREGWTIRECAEEVGLSHPRVDAILRRER